MLPPPPKYALLSKGMHICLMKYLIILFLMGPILSQPLRPPFWNAVFEPWGPLVDSPVGMLGGLHKYGVFGP